MTKNILLLFASVVTFVTMGAGCVQQDTTKQANANGNAASSVTAATTIFDPTTTQSVKIFVADVGGIEVSFPASHTLTKSKEVNRRGSFVSYEFKQEPEDNQSVDFKEMHFFSATSIKNFIENCHEGDCWEGDAPDIARYLGQKKAFAAGKDYQNFKLQKFGTRSWFVSTFSCSGGDSCVIKEYTTFLGNTKLDVWVSMLNDAQQKQADALFAQFKIEQPTE